MSSSNIWNAPDVALILIDYQEEMFSQIRSSDPAEIELNVKYLIKAARAFNVPIILSTVGVQMGVNKPTRGSIAELLPDVKPIDRSSMDAWEDEKFVAAVKATGKKKLIICGLYTEICLTYPVIEALDAGYEVSFVADAVAGLTMTAHKMAQKRMIQAGAIPNTTFATVTEMFRDWKSELATKARPLMVEYMSEYRDLDAALSFGDRNEISESRVHQ